MLACVATSRGAHAAKGHGPARNASSSKGLYHLHTAARGFGRATAPARCHQHMRAFLGSTEGDRPANLLFELEALGGREQHRTSAEEALQAWWPDE